MVDPDFPQNLTHNAIQVIGFDAYSADGQQVGRVAGYVDQVPEDKVALEPGTVDVVTPDGKPVGPRRLLVDGQGFALQAEIAVPEDQVTVDLPGRRVTLPLTVEQIRALPHHHHS